MEDIDYEAAARVLAQYIGVDIESEPELIRVAEDALHDLPYGWMVHVADGENQGIPYYIDSKNDKSSWTHPYQSKYIKLVQAERKRLKVEAEVDKLREMKWRMWVEGKELLDGSVEIFHKLSTGRANDPEQLREVTIALSAVDILVGNDHKSPHSIHFHQRKGKKNRKYTKSAWLKWMMANRTFSDVVLTEEQYDLFSETVRSMVMEENGEHILSSLQYTKPGKGKGLDSLRPDEKLLNIMFVEECNRVWEDCNDELNVRVYEHIARGKMTVDLGSTAKTDSAMVYECLFALSMPRLRAWQEDDEDEAADEARREKNSKEHQGKSEFESWVKYKDSMKMVLPDSSEVVPMKPIPRMSFAGNNLTDIRPKEAGAPQTTTDLMINSGMKQVHANYGKGKPDPFVDLKESRRRLMEMGFVHKDNFDETDDPDNPFDKTRYSEHKTQNITLIDRKERQRLQDLSKGKAYDAWASLKEAREQALIYLDAIPKPVSTGDSSTQGSQITKVNSHRAGGGPTSRPPVVPPSFGKPSASSLRDSVSANAIKPYAAAVNGDKSGSNQSSALPDIIKIGQALKKIDRTLFNHWSKWADCLITPAVAAVMWDFFYPRTCDLHGMVGTDAKNSFLRVLYANPKFVEFMDHPYVFTYREFVPEKWRRRERLVENKSDLSNEEKRNFLFQAPLTRDEFSKLLLDMGVLMTGMELKSLVDAFDPEDTGMIDMTDFLKYAWPKRETNAGALDVLSKKCSWSSSCRRTGMVNGFVVTIRDRNGSERAPSRHDDNDSDGIVSDDEEQHKPHIGPMLKHQLQEKVVSVLSNGDEKIVREVADRQKRERILARYGLLPKNGFVEKSLPIEHVRGLSTISVIGRKISSAVALKEQTDKVADKTLDIHNSAIPVENLESTIPGSATINIPYAPKAESKNVHGSARFADFQTFLDDCEMYEGNQKGIISLNDFKVVLADADIQFTPHELKYVSKHFGATSSRDSAAINHLALGEALEMALYLEVGDAVEARFKGQDAWCPAVIARDNGGTSYDVKYVSLTMSGRVIKPPNKKYEEDPDDDDDDKYVDEEYEQEEEDEEKKRKNRKRFKRLAKGRKDEPCQYALWLRSCAGRKEGLRYLAEMSKEARAVMAVNNLIETTVVPTAPLCWSVNPDEEDATFADGDEFNPTTEILLRWRPGTDNDSVSFYSIEFAGQAGCIGAEMRFKEIYRDPPNASGVKCCYQYRMQNLEPATSYLFRIRAVNGSGASDYTYLTITTRLVLAIYPRVVKLSMNSVTLRWLFTPQSQRRLAQLRKVFHEALYQTEKYQKDKSTSEINKEELAAVLDNAIETFSDLKPFLSKAKHKYGIPDNAWGDAKFLSVLDNMEKDTGDEISWDELEKFFIASGFVESDVSSSKSTSGFRQQVWKGSGSTCKCGQMSVGVRASLSATAPTKGSMSQAMRSLRAGATGFAGMNIYAVGGGAHCCVTSTPCEDCCSGNTARITYVVEQLGADGEYHDILRTTGGQGTINRLVPGETYKFRIYGLNQDGTPGPRSEVIVLHMPFETPAPPCIALQGCCSGTPKALIGPRSITLRWKERQAIKFANTRDKTFVKKMLMEWSGQVPEGPSVTSGELEIAFQEFDTNGDGFIDPAELGKLLAHLGIAPTEQKFKSAFSEICDHDGDGTITFEELSQWWHNSSVEYVLKRSSAIRDPRNAEAMLHCVAAGALRGSSTVGRSAALNVLVCGTSRRGGTLVWKGTSWREWEKDKDPSWHVTIGGKEATPYEYRREHPIDIDGDVKDPSNDENDAENVDGLDGEVAASISDKDVLVRQEITTDIVCYRGKELQFEEKGLTPNQMYYFKLRHVGVRSSSFLSPSLMVMTAPLPCRKPAFVRLQGSSARLKWYPPDYGAHTFEVQLQLTGNSNSSKSGSNGDSSTSSVGSDWVNVYNGQETTWTATSATLTPETSYNIRVVGINAQGTYGEASPVLSFTTPSRDTNKEPITKKNVDDDFTIECMGDICVGDIILVTERLFKYDNGNIDISENSNLLTAPASSGATGLSKSSLAPKRRSNNKSERIKAEEKLRLDLGITSETVRKLSLNDSSNNSQPVKETNTGGIGATFFQPVPGLGQFAGERTFAAHVVWDNYRSIKEDRPDGAAPLNKATFGKERRCWLEVIWSRGSNGAARRNELQPGSVVSRTQAHLEQFEVYRHPWLHENQRRPLEEELNLLANCYGKFTNYHHYQCHPGY